LQSGHLLILCRDASAKILKIEIDINGILYEDKKNCQVIQTLLEEGEPSENSGIELSSGNLIISQGYFINFFEKRFLFFFSCFNEINIFFILFIII